MSTDVYQPPKPETPHWTEVFFFHLGGSVLYLLSGLCIVYGLIQVIGPTLQDSNSIGENLKCLFVLHCYELALVGVALLIVLWRRVEDDAVSLTVLITLFFVVSGITLDTIGHNREYGPPSAFWIGLGSFLLTFAKLQVLRRYILRGMSWSALLMLLLFLAWNFLSPSAMTMLRHWQRLRNDAMQLPWQLGWFWILGAALAFVWLLATKRPHHHAGRTFLRTPTMAWVMGVLLLVACSIHQYAQAHVFDIPVKPSDWLPALCALVMLLNQLRRHASAMVHWIEPVLLLVGPIAAFCMVKNGGWAFPQAIPDWCFYPPITLFATGALSIALAWKQRRMALLHGLALYPVAIVLPLGPTTVAVTGLLIAVAYAWRYSCPYMVMIAGWILAVAIPQYWFLGECLEQAQISRAAFGALLGSLSTILAEIWLGRSGSAGQLCIACFVLNYGLFGCFFVPASALYAPAIGTTMSICLVGAASWRRQELLPAVPGSAPLFYSGYNMFCVATGWAFILLSFVLLGIGTVVSLRKGTQGQAE